MSEIFNLILWKNNMIDIVYIFIGKDITITEKDKKNLGSRGKNIIDDTLWNKIIQEQIPYKIIPESIYRDDTILRIKQKIIKYTELKISLPELYIFTCKESFLEPNKYYNELTQNEFLDLNSEKVEIFLKNIQDGKIHTSEAFDINKYVEEKKSLYLFSDFISLNNISFYSKNILKISVGVDAIYNKRYPYIVNPYQISKQDNIILNEQASVISQNKKLLFEYGNPINNSIYLCLASDVMEHYTETTISNEYILKLYFPQLYSNYKIRTIEELNMKRPEIIENNRETIENINEIENAIVFLNRLNNYGKNRLNRIAVGIKDIFITLHPTKFINVPLETIFKIIHCSETVPLIKFNSGKELMNIYRLYTGDNISTTGKKVPSLYVDYNKRQVKIKKLANILARRRRIGFFIKHNTNEILCEFLENGNIEIKLDILTKKTTIDESLFEVESILRDVINNTILHKINKFTSEIGYEFSLFKSLTDENVEINNINYFSHLSTNRKIDLTKYIGCLYPVFIINDGVINKSSDMIDLIYKRVSSFQEMSSIDSFLTILHRKNLSLKEIRKILSENFGMSIEKASEKIKQWQENVTLQTEQFENKRVSVKNNPGFRVKIKHETVDYGKGYEVILKSEVENINSIYYLKHIEIYINSILSIIAKETELSEGDILRRCKSKVLVDLKEDENMKDNEFKIEDILNNEMDDEGIVFLGSDEELIDSDGDLSDFIESDYEEEDEDNEYESNDDKVTEGESKLGKISPKQQSKKKSGKNLKKTLSKIKETSETQESYLNDSDLDIFLDEDDDDDKKKLQKSEVPTSLIKTSIEKQNDEISKKISLSEALPTSQPVPPSALPPVPSSILPPALSAASPPDSQPSTSPDLSLEESPVPPPEPPPEPLPVPSPEPLPVPSPASQSSTSPDLTSEASPAVSPEGPPPAPQIDVPSKPPAPPPAPPPTSPPVPKPPASKPPHHHLLQNHQHRHLHHHLLQNHQHRHLHHHHLHHK